ncbi:cytochrome c oxidase assembly protein [Nocardia jejuensis]|uniref:cytochrome c oxidase assembly protein n=1 Tax=Nocardia jejuensis TaxID=328049 RepID=UPI0008359CAA|nr:cytochrome c oxidase assembly protein [Nocardia jejuensis]
MPEVETPLQLSGVVAAWRWDTASIVITVMALAAYAGCRRIARRRGASLSRGRAVCFGLGGLGVWLLTGVGVLGVYSDTLFWVRALQTLLLLYLVPFALAAGMPLTVLRAALGSAGRARLDTALSSRPARLLTYPAVPSLLILAVPWLLFLTPWYEAVLRHGAIDAATRILLVLIGFLYFYSRLQVDPVPRRFTQGISLLITIAESLADGVLGIVLWLGPLVAADYYGSLGRAWGPSTRMDQTIGAGVFWLLGDLLGLTYALVVMRAFARDERRRAFALDAELDATASAETVVAGAPSHESRSREVASGLWWENDPQLRDRFHR